MKSDCFQDKRCMLTSPCAALLTAASDGVMDPTTEPHARGPSASINGHCIIDYIWFYFINTHYIKCLIKLSCGG